MIAWACGSTLFAAASRLGGQIDSGHFKVVWLVSAALSALAGPAHPAAWLLAGVCALAFVLVWPGRDRIPGLVAAAGAVGVLLAAGRPLGFTLAAALLMGGVTNAMLLGHWHLNQPRLGTQPLMRLLWALWAGLALFGAASGVLVAQALDRAVDAAVLGGLTALAFTVFAAVLTAMVTHLVRKRSIMSATGILYLEILLCLVAVFTGSLGALAL